ncbi:hypothetical protein [Pantoea sp. GM01]|uniref:hypothetical protein n=1 Tax=Pantoea sp. GM01 TaxID=1144320 RepID=UPI000270FFD9|nr:hypothetical protein [Pantoea sp. GM01]EJL90238.1 hypothetical protein PMI17_01758 [Pantoea sp. GM01]
MSKSYYMRDDHSFLLLPVDAELALDVIYHEFEQGFSYGMLCTKNSNLNRVVHAEGNWEDFRHEAKQWLNEFMAIQTSGDDCRESGEGAE